MWNDPFLNNVYVFGMLHIPNMNNILKDMYRNVLFNTHVSRWCALFVVQLVQDIDEVGWRCIQDMRCCCIYTSRERCMTTLFSAHTHSLWQVFGIGDYEIFLISRYSLLQMGMEAINNNMNKELYRNHIYFISLFYI